MCIIHKGFRGFRAASPASNLGGNLIGLKPAIPYEIIHSPLGFMQKRPNILKQLSTIFFFLVTTTFCLGQSLFFDDIENSIWTTDSSFTKSTLTENQEIGLTKLRITKDSIRTDCVIWTFNDSLIVTYFDATLKQEKTIGKYAYKHENDNGLLVITVDDNGPISYAVGIVSTGSFVLLTKKKEKNEKARKPNNGYKK